MKKKVCKFLLKLMRYKPDFESTRHDIPQYVLVFAPHTSWRDFVIGKLFLVAMGVKTSFLIKKEAFFFPLGPILKKLGGIHVTRTNYHKFTDQVAALFKDPNLKSILVCPEGTRRCVSTWKKGFYTIGEKANVPFVLGYIDYNTRRCGMGPVFYPTGNYEEDVQQMQEFFYGMRGRRKGHFYWETFGREKGEG